MKMPRGVQVRGENLRINFTLYGQRHFIRLKDHFENQIDIDSADGILKKIRRDIKMGTFEWSVHFPWHKNAKEEQRSGDKLSVSELLDDYLVNFVRSRREAITEDHYNYRSNRFLKPAFGHIIVADLKPEDITRWAVQMGNTGVSNITLKSYIAPLRSAFKYARSHGITYYNPFNDFEWPEETREVRSKKIQRKRQNKLDVFNMNEVAALCSKAEREQERNIIQFGFWTGLRPEELFALHWSDIDWLRERARISRAKVYRRGYALLDYQYEDREIIKGIKTGELGERDVILMPPALEALERQKKWTKKQKTFIFHNQFHERPWVNTNQFRNRFKEVCDKVGVRYRRPYMMRHTYASMMLKKGEDEQFISNQLGHVNTEMVRKVYSHFIPDDDEGGYELRGDWKIDFLKFSPECADE